MDLILFNSIKFLGIPFNFMNFSVSTISLIWSINQMSIPDNLWIFLVVNFLLKASATKRIRFGILIFKFLAISFVE